MPRTSHLFGTLVAGAILTALTSCGDDDGGGGARLVGAILLPPAGQCQGCTNAGVPVTVSALQKDAAPAPVSNFATDANGNYDSGDLSAQLGGRRALVVVAGVAQNTGIGGVEAVQEGTNANDFDVGTQVACVASVLLTQGTASAGDPGCTVRAACGPGDPGNCLPTIDPSQVTRERIRNLETAAAFIEDRVQLPGDQNRAACAVINCTFGGAGPTTSDCVNGLF